jgi:oligopeptidase A
MHPFLDQQFHVKWSTLTPKNIEIDIQYAINEAQKNIASICELDTSKLTYENTFEALENAAESLNRGWGRLNHLDSVADNSEQREELNKMLADVSAFYSSIALNGKLWDILKEFGSSPEVKKLSQIQQRHVSEAMLDFVQNGADLSADKKQRISEIEAELSQLTKKYSENVLDATNAWEIIITDSTQLSGLPESAKAAAFANAKSKGLSTDEKPAWRFTLQHPSMLPIMQHADDENLRRDVWLGSSTVGSIVPHDNTDLVWKILDLRQEKAELLGHKNFADLTLKRRMAKNAKTAIDFTEGLHIRIKEAFLNEYQELCAYKAHKKNSAQDDLEPWEVGYWSEKRRKENFDFDEEILRPYFSVNRVMNGMFNLASTLFGVIIKQKNTVYYGNSKTEEKSSNEEVEVWHPEISFYEIFDQKSSEHLGSFYADWHPRESKRGGAWMNQLETGMPPSHDTNRTPHLGLIIGNMSPPIDGKEALLTHREVETIFHEFGHLLHGLLSEVSVKSLSGTNVPWDFVELPSQIMENFCWSRESLDLFARHHETNQPIPDDIYQKMIAAKNYMSATGFMRQLAFAILDLELHTHLEKWNTHDLDQTELNILKDFQLPLKTKSPAMARRFNHLFSSPTGYAAGYYSYKWAEVLDADAFTRFNEEGVLNEKTGSEFREHILSKGNSEPVDELYRRFMKRDPKLKPLLSRAGLLNHSVC